MNTIVKTAAKVAGNSLWHSLRRFLSVAFIGLLLWAVWVTVIQPHTKFKVDTLTTHQTAERISNITISNPDDSFFIGIKVFGLKFGISKPEKKEMREVIKENDMAN